MGGTASCIINAADEIAVSAFLEGRIGFTAIARVVETTLSRMPLKDAANVAEILDVDAEARRVAQNVIVTNPQVFAPARVPAQA
jgi:1-deoxy-D-xylulose-5-phosphate reductoisomerase